MLLSLIYENGRRAALDYEEREMFFGLGATGVGLKRCWACAERCSEGGEFLNEVGTKS